MGDEEWRADINSNKSIANFGSDYYNNFFDFISGYVSITFHRVSVKMI
jgi:hypothetical protein